MLALLNPLLKYLCGGLAFVSLMLGIALHMERVHGRKQAAQIENLTELRKADRASYEVAQAQAEAKNLADVRAKEGQYKRNNDEAVSSLNDRIARLRRELSAHSGSAPGSTGRSSLPQADHPSGVAGEAGVHLTSEELLRAAENEERYDQLITLILKQTDPAANPRP